MRSNISKLLFGVIACLFVAQLAKAALSSTTSEFTSSTSGSVKSIFTQNETERLNHFVDQNFDRLQEEAARGNGATLNDYVNLMGCQNPGLISQEIQKNYPRLFENGKTQLLPRTQQMIQSNSALAQACEVRS